MIHDVVRRRTGQADPYEEVKARDIATALRLEPLLRHFAATGPDPLQQALKVSANWEL